MKKLNEMIKTGTKHPCPTKEGVVYQFTEAYKKKFIEVNRENKKRVRNFEALLLEFFENHSEFRDPAVFGLNDDACVRLDDLRKVFNKENKEKFDHASFKTELAKAIFDSDNFQGMLKVRCYKCLSKPLKVEFNRIIEKGEKVRHLNSTPAFVFRKGDDFTKPQTCNYDRIDRRVFKHVTHIPKENARGLKPGDEGWIYTTSQEELLKEHFGGMEQDALPHQGMT
jgi:hypothetical protein